MKNSDRKRGAGTQARPCGQVAVVMNLQTLLNVHISNGFSDGRVDNIVYLVDVFDLRPNDTMTVLEERWKCAAGNVAVFVDCRR